MKEHECPGHRIRRGFFELIHLELFITDALLVASQALNI